MRTHSGLHILCGTVFRDFGALVTGGNRGLGRACADALAEAGASVIVTARSSETGRRTETRPETIEDAGRAACVMAGGCETVIYVLALYFSVTGVTRMRHAFACGMLAYLAGIAVSLVIVRLI